MFARSFKAEVFSHQAHQLMQDKFQAARKMEDLYNKIDPESICNQKGRKWLFFTHHNIHLSATLGYAVTELILKANTKPVIQPHEASSSLQPPAQSVKAEGNFVLIPPNEGDFLPDAEELHRLMNGPFDYKDHSLYWRPIKPAVIPTTRAKPGRVTLPDKRTTQPELLRG
jgi:hypothetical protein